MNRKDNMPSLFQKNRKEIDGSPNSDLAKRLFRNSSINKLSPQNSLLSINPMQDSNSSILNSSWNSQLVASISLKKLKKKGESEKYMEFNKGKILVNPHHSYFESLHKSKQNKRSKKHMFKKLQKLNYSPTHSLNNRIIPDDLIDYPIESDDLSQIRLPSKSNSIFRNKNKKNQNKKLMENEDLLPEDFMQLLKEDNLVNQFCYLKKMDHPYDLKIIQFDKSFEKKQEEKPSHYPNQYITISSRGVTYFSPENSRFVPLDEWKREAEHFRKIIKLDFFKNFKVIKNFGSWKKYIRKSAMKTTIEQLQQKLVLGDRYLRASVLETRSQCMRLENQITYCKLEDTQFPMKYRQFKTLQETFIQEDFLSKIMDVEEEIKEKVKINMTESMKQFKEENKISSSVEGKGMPLLIGDEKNLEMPYTKEATLRTQQQKFKRFVKLIDLMITHSKVNMMEESTEKLRSRIDEENMLYQKQVIESGESSSKFPFKGKKLIICDIGLDSKDHSIVVKPNREQLNGLFQEIVSKSVVRLCRNHKKISQDSEILSVIYDDIENMCKQSDGDMLKMIMTSDEKQDDMLCKIMKSINESYEFIEIYLKSFVKLAAQNHQNFEYLKQMDTYCAKDHQKILQIWQNQLEALKKINETYESSIIVLNLKQFTDKARSVTTTCINKAKQLIPKVFDSEIAKLTSKISVALSQMQNQPLGVKSYIEFQNNKSRINDDIEEYSNMMMQINCFDILVKNMMKTNENVAKNREKQIRELQNKLILLRKKLEETDINNKLYEKRAQDQVNSMQPKNEQKIKQLDAKITGFIHENKSTQQINNFIVKRKKQLDEIVKQSEDIREYQDFLKLPEIDPVNLNCFTEFFDVFQHIWETFLLFQNYEAQILDSCWKDLQPEEVFQKLEQFIDVAISLDRRTFTFKQNDSIYQLSQSDTNALKNLLIRIQNLKPLVEVIECLKDKAFQDKKQLSKTLNSVEEKEMLKRLEWVMPETAVRELRKCQIVSQLHIIKSILSKGKRYNDVFHKSHIVEEFIRQNISIMRSLSDRIGFDCDKFLKELNEKILIANFDIRDLELKEKGKIEKTRNTLEKLREIILLWKQHENYTEYFEQFEKFGEWRATKQAKIYLFATQNWKKTIKQFKDAQLGKITATNQKLIISTLRQCNQQIQELYQHSQQFLNSKRYQSSRLVFLTDEEILKLYSENKDYRSFSQYINKLFPYIQKLTVKEQQQLPASAINVSGEELLFKSNRNISMEIDQMIRIVEDCIKTALKASFRNCFQAFDNEEFNRTTWIKEYPLQTILFITEVYVTKIIEQDYLYEGEDMDRLLQYHISETEKLTNILREQSDSLTKKKVQILISQSIHTRDKVSYLIDKDVRSSQDYEWIKQIRHYYHSDIPTVQYLAYPITYGFQFVSLYQNPLLLNYLNEKALIQIVNQIWLCRNLPVSKTSLLQQFALYHGKSYHKLQLTTGNEQSILERYILGTYISGSLTDINLPDELNSSQLELITSLYEEIEVALSHKEAYFRGYKNMPLHQESGIFLISTCDNFSCKASQTIRNNYRQIQIPTIPYSLCLKTLLCTNEKFNESFLKRLGSILDYLRNTFNMSVLSFSQMKKIIIQVINVEGSIKNFEVPLDKRLIKAFKKQIIGKMKTKNDRKFIGWVFRELFEISEWDQKAKTMTFSSRSLAEINPFELMIQTINKQLNLNKVCVISGKNELTSMMLAERLREKFTSPEVNKQYYLINEKNIGVLFGQYREGKWNEGVIIKEVRLDKDRNQLLILKGKSSEKILSVLQKLRTVYMLENGERFVSNSNIRFVFVSQKQIAHKDKAKIFDIYPTDHIKLRPQNIFHHEISLCQIQSHFQNTPVSYATFSNLLLNFCEKIYASNLKMVGYNTVFLKQQLVIKRCIRILGAILHHDSENCCSQKVKILEKSINWALFWAIGSSIPKSSMERLQKIYELIKIEYDKSQFLGESKFFISSRNESVSKSIKTSFTVILKNTKLFKINELMDAKLHFIRLLIQTKNPILLMGEPGNGKSICLDYIYQAFNDDNYSTLRISLTKNTSLTQFMQKFHKKTLYIGHPNKQFSHCLQCYNGKQLLVLIDNFNQVQENSELQRFFSNCFSYGYYIDEHKNEKVKIGNISFICAETSSFASIQTLSFLDCFIPVYISNPEVREVIECYANSGIASQNQNSLKSLINPIESIHNYAMSLSNHKWKMIYPSPITLPKWIFRQLQRFCNSKNQSIEQLIILWKFLTMKKYVDSGLHAGHTKHIKDQLNSLINLVSKNDVSNVQIFPQERLILQSVIEQFPILEHHSHFYDQYLYLLYLMKARQARHLITVNEIIPSDIKAQLISSLCSRKDIRFVYVENLIQLNLEEELAPTLLYIDCRCQGLKQLLEPIIQKILEDQSESKSFNYMVVLDISDNRELQQLINNHPDLYENISIYNQSISINPKAFDSYYLFECLQETPQMELLWQIYKQSKNLSPIITNALNTQIASLSKASNTISSLEQDIESIETQTKKLKQEVEETYDRETYLIQRKNLLVQELKVENSQSVQCKKSKLTQLLNEIENIKRNKIEKCSQINMLDETLGDKKPIRDQLMQMSQQIRWKLEEAQKMLKKKNIMVRIVAVLEVYYQKPEYLPSGIAKLQKICDYFFASTAEKLISSLYAIEIKDIQNQLWLIKWFNTNLKAKFHTNHSNHLLHQIQLKIPSVKICKHAYEIQENLSKAPLVTEIDGFWGDKQVTTIHSNDSPYSPISIKFDVSPEQKTQIFMMQLLQLLDHEKYYELRGTRQQLKRYQIQIAKYETKIKRKLEEDLPTSKLGELKQFLEIRKTLREKSKACQNTLHSIQQHFNLRFGSILEDCLIFYQYLKVFAQKLPYFHFKPQFLINLISNAQKSAQITMQLEQQEKQAEETLQGQNQSQEKPENKIDEQQLIQNKLKITKANIYTRIIKWMQFSIQTIDSIFTMFICACGISLSNNQGSQSDIAIIISIWDTLRLHQKPTQEDSQRWNPTNSIVSEIVNIYQCKGACDQMMERMKKYTERVFEIGVIQECVKGWREQLPAIVQDQKEKSRFFYAIGNNKANFSKIIDKQLRYKPSTQQMLLLLSQEEFGENADNIQKLQIQNQCWIVTINWSNLQRIGNIVKFVEGNPNINLIIYHDIGQLKQQSFSILKKNRFSQVWINDHSSTLPQQIKRLFSKFWKQDNPNQLTKILRIHVLEVISRALHKNYSSMKNFPVSTFEYRPLEHLIKKNPKLTSVDLTKALLDYYYSPNKYHDRAVLRQIKKIVKTNEIQEWIGEDGQNPKESLTLLDQDYDNICDQFQDMMGLKDLLSSFIPTHAINNTNFYQYQKPLIDSIRPEPLYSRINQEQIINLLNAVLSRVQTNINAGQEPQNKGGFSLQIIVEERQEEQNQLKKVLERFSELIKIVETGKSLKNSIQNQLHELVKIGEENIIESLNKKVDKINTFNKLIQQKNPKESLDNLQIIRNAKKYLFFCMLQSHINAPPKSKSQAQRSEYRLQRCQNLNGCLVGRCFTEKQKEIYKVAIQNGEYLLVNNLYIENGQFDPHKLTLQNYSSSKTLGSKISNIYFSVMKQSQQIQKNYQKLAWMMQQQKISDIWLMSKCKEERIWCSAPYIKQRV